MSVFVLLERWVSKVVSLVCRFMVEFIEIDGKVGGNSDGVKGRVAHCRSASGMNSGGRSACVSPLHSDGPTVKSHRTPPKPMG